MEIIVCVKQILDPEIPMDKFRIKGNRVDPPPGIPPVISPYDAHAVEAALRLKEKRGGKVTAITLGSQDAEDVIRRALSMGVDAGVLLTDPAFGEAGSLTTALALSQAIKKIGAYDLIFCGREAADRNMGTVGPLISEILGLPLITLAKNVELINENAVRVERVIPDGSQVFEVQMPAVVTISKEIGLPRLPTGRGIIKAAQAKIPVWTAQDIAFAPVKAGVTDPKLVSLAIIERDRKCEFINGENARDLVADLLGKLRNAGML